MGCNSYVSVLNEEQSEFLRELVGPCSKFFEVSSYQQEFIVFWFWPIFFFF